MKPAITPLKVYYWPFLGRAGPIFRMLEYTGTPFEHISSRAELAKFASSFGAKSTTFAPPVVVDGDYRVSQSTAAAFYVGQRVGLVPPGFDAAQAFQHMADTVDMSELNFGKNNEHGPTLKKFLEGSRWASLMGNIERGIKGPFFFGEKPSCADFFLFATMDARDDAFFAPLKKMYGVDVMKSFPKTLAICKALRASEGYKNSSFKLSGPSEKVMAVLKAYNDPE